MKLAMKRFRGNAFSGPRLHKSLSFKAAATDRSLSDLVNEALNETAYLPTGSVS